MAGSISLRINQSVSVSTHILDSYGSATSAATINYISLNPEVAILANQGVFTPGVVPQNSLSTNIITGIGAGTTTVEVRIDGDTLIDTISVSVSAPPPESLSFVFGTPAP